MIAAVRVDDPGKLADTISAHLLIGVEEKQNLRGIVSPLERLNRIAAILEAAGSSIDRVVRATVYLADMNDFTAMNDVYGTYFSMPAPARSTIQAARLPKDARVEVDVIAEIS